MTATTFYVLPQPRPHLSLTRPGPSQPNRVTLRARPGPTPIRASSSDGSATSARLDPLSFYELLGIPSDGTLGEIKQAYRDMARRYHPDVCPPGRVEEYTERFIRVQEAYETLSDPRRRAMYDGDLARGMNLAFSARRRCNAADEGMEDKSEWKNRWQSQLSELKRRSTHKYAGGNMSWGAKIRKQKNDLSDDGVLENDCTEFASIQDYFSKWVPENTVHAC